MFGKITLYSSIFFSGLFSGLFIMDYLPEDINFLKKKMGLFYGKEMKKITREEIARKAEQRQIK